MKVLVTGSSGLLGSEVQRRLQDRGVEVVPYDLRQGQDILAGDSLDRAATGCHAIIHAAALLEPDSGDPDRLRRVNVEGTGKVLAAARRAGARRVVYLSSLSVLGVFKGHGRPDYLPLDPGHPCRPSTDYEASKLAAEGLCSAFATSGHGSAVTLRVPGVWRPETYDRIRRARERDPKFEWHPFWEYGAFLDVRDLAEACHAAISVELDGHVVLFLSSSDITTSGRTSREWVRTIHPDVEWRGGEAFEREPYRSLVDTADAGRILGWAPRHTWGAYLRARQGNRGPGRDAH